MPPIKNPTYPHHQPPTKTHAHTKIIATMADNEEDQDLVDYDEEEEEQNVAAEESADAEGKETKK